MLKSLRAVARFFQKTIGWNRIGVLLSIAIIAVAVVVLFHMLRDINTRRSRRGAKGDPTATYRRRRILRCLRLFHADLL